jgi:hypothetical protein
MTIVMKWGPNLLILTILFAFKIKAQESERDLFMQQLIYLAEPFKYFNQIKYLPEQNFFFIGEAHGYLEHENINNQYLKFLISRPKHLSMKWCIFLEAKIEDTPIINHLKTIIHDPQQIQAYINSFPLLSMNNYPFSFIHYIKIADKIGAEVLAVDTSNSFFQRNRDMTDLIHQYWKKYQCELGFMEIGHSHLDSFQDKEDDVPIQALVDQHQSIKTHSLAVYARDYISHHKVPKTRQNFKLCPQGHHYCPSICSPLIYQGSLLTMPVDIAHLSQRKINLTLLDALLLIPSAKSSLKPLPPIVFPKRYPTAY